MLAGLWLQPSATATTATTATIIRPYRLGAVRDFRKGGPALPCSALLCSALLCSALLNVCLVDCQPGALAPFLKTAVLVRWRLYHVIQFLIFSHP